MKRYTCIDVGGTSIKYGVLNTDLKFENTDEMKTEAEKGGQNIVNKIIEIINKCNSLYDSIEGICISTAGIVDCDKGEIIYAPSTIPNYIGTKIKETIENKFNIKCEVENDVNCAALAEHFAGGSKGSNISVCLTIGTGIGGGIVINDKIHHGAFGAGGEVGQMNMLGSKFEKLGSASSLVKKLAELKGIDYENINGKFVFEKAKEGDLDCIKAIDEMIDILGRGIANICYVINPEVVVLGGGIMAQKEYLYDKIRASIDKYLIPLIAEKTKLEFAVNLNKAGMIGAYLNFINMQEIRSKG